MCESFTKSIIALWLITLNKRLFVKDPNPSVIHCLPIKCHLLNYERCEHKEFFLHNSGSHSRLVRKVTHIGEILIHELMII